MTAVISTRGLTKAFGEHLALRDLSIDIAVGEVFGFLGHNGAGKTTTVRLLNGVLEPTSGTVRVLGFDPIRDGAKVRARTGVLTETPALDARLSARDTLRFFAEVYGLPAAQIGGRIDELLDLFELTARAGDKVGAYSKGMRQRLALARTLIHDPELVFLDEPTAGLDPAATREVHQLVDRLTHRGRTVFLCTHNLIEAERLCDRVAVLAEGRLLAIGSTHDLAAQLTAGHRVCVEIATPDVGRAQQLLATTSQVTMAEVLADRTAERNGSALISMHGVTREAIPRIVETLARAGIAIYRIEPEAPSLEDVYFALQEGDR